jgi:formylglycine-generating enzyme required for sulfatase activity
MELDSGSYSVEVSAPGYDTESMWVKLGSGQDTRVTFRLEPVVTVQTGQKITGDLRMEFVYLRRGSFLMGSPSGEPKRDRDESRHQVTLTKGFYLQTTEVTVGQWRSFVREMGYKSDAERGLLRLSRRKSWRTDRGKYWDNPGFSQTDAHPVTCVSWNDVQEFVKWLNAREGNIYRLPTEAEWEYACRAGGRTAYSFGDDPAALPAHGWYWENAGEETHPVGQKKPNGWGLYDMHGNVWEWCHDYYGRYPSGAVTDPKGPFKGNSRVNRGGSWFNGARLCRSAIRNRVKPAEWHHGLGFRLVRTR